MNTISHLQTRYESYTADSLTTNDVKFWVLFWGAVFLSCLGYYECVYNIADFWVQLKLYVPYQLVVAACVLLPTVVLRRLQVVGLVFALYFMGEWLKKH